MINKNHEQFSHDMEVAGFEDKLINYRGRFFYHGPAVVVPDDMIQEVIRATKVRLTQDNMGFDYVLYPS